MTTENLKVNPSGDSELMVPIEKVQFELKLHYSAFPEPLTIRNMNPTVTVGELRKRVPSLLNNIGLRTNSPDKLKVRLIYWGHLLDDDDATLLKVFSEPTIRSSPTLNLHLAMTTTDSSSPFEAVPKPKPIPPVRSSPMLTEAEMQLRIQAHFNQRSQASSRMSSPAPRSRAPASAPQIDRRTTESVNIIAAAMQRHIAQSSGSRNQQSVFQQHPPDHSTSQFLGRATTPQLPSRIHTPQLALNAPYTMQQAYAVHNANGQLLGFVHQDPTPSRSFVVTSPFTTVPNTATLFTNLPIYHPNPRPLPSRWEPYVPTGDQDMFPMPPIPPESLRQLNPLDPPRPIPEHDLAEAIQAADIANYIQLYHQEEAARNRPRRPPQQLEWIQIIRDHFAWAFQLGIIAYWLLSNTEDTWRYYFLCLVLTAVIARRFGLVNEIGNLGQETWARFIANIMPRIDAHGRLVPPGNDPEAEHDAPAVAPVVPANPRGPVDPAEIARRLRRNAHLAQVNGIMGFIDGVQRLFMIFVASFVPGLAEGHIRNLEQERQRREEAARLRAEEEKNRKQEKEEEKKRKEEEEKKKEFDNTATGERKDGVEGKSQVELADEDPLIHEPAASRINH